MTEQPDEPSTEIRELRARKRLVYALVLVGGIAITLLSWWFRGPDDPFLARVYPPFAAVLAGLLVVLWRQWLTLEHLEGLMVLVASALILGRLAWHMHFAAGIEQQLMVLVGGHFWAVGLLVAGAFVMLDRRRGMIAGIVILGISILLTVTGALREYMAAAPPAAETLMYLVRVHVFLGLLLALLAAVAGMRDQLQRALLRAEILHDWATTDPLTGLANRRAAEAGLEREIAYARRYGQPMSVIIADLDHFKDVNDTHGHAHGDRVLREVTARLQARVRDSDLTARWGGEELLVVAPGIDLREATALAERCRRALAEEPVAGLGITATLGVAEFTPEDDRDSLLARADRQLYAGKAAGRNRVVPPPDPLPGT
ncbi:GGDEF domain-containing protein [Thioalkalivibrio halophilus]|uniref:diguanylate cyclase n=1 Tax=Thioalkalivibrio halophilus TaxID=252474 RepID=A0A1V2ZWK5_9GAMM|nr:GGDEF domain-containing protein [Thioalkalivibrio halophilus]OOC09502.1 GGDEF domain-containing protein [Thioalkalivibrio halophilus]